jgi:hypothetical protein
MSPPAIGRKRYARGFAEASALATAVVAALDRFTAGTGVALCRRNGEGRSSRQQVSTIDALEVVNTDKPMAAALCAGRSVASCNHVHSTLPVEFAMVLSRQREPDAFMLMAACAMEGNPSFEEASSAFTSSSLQAAGGTTN